MVVNSIQEKTKSLFVKFNELFFEDRLSDAIEWSEKRMTSSSAIFYPKKRIIRMNMSLLSKVSEAELIETLLHEMTHSYLYQKYGSRIKPHGKEFKSKIKTINEFLNINIPTTHNYLTNWFRCDGEGCRHHPLFYFGYISSQAQNVYESDSHSCRDFLELHAKTCSGTFVKSNEPSGMMMKRIRAVKRREKKMISEERSKNSKRKRKEEAEESKKHSARKTKFEELELWFNSNNVTETKTAKKHRYSTDDDK